MREYLLDAKTIAGHNFIRFDVVHLERVLGIKIKAKIIDTLALSWYLEPDRNRHGLESYGDDYGVPKPVIDDWYNLTLDAYVNRCEQDTIINRRLWDNQWSRLLRIYGNEQEAVRFIDYLSFKMKCAQLQEKSGWKLDLKFTEESLAKLLQEQQYKIQHLINVMPKVPVKVKKTVPKKPVKKDGTLSRIGQEWFDLLDRHNLPKSTDEVEVIVEYKEGNPKSIKQLKEWLDSLGWKPETFEYKKDKETKEMRVIPKINKPHGAGICDSIKKLYDKCPDLEVLDGLSIINHRISILEGFIRDCDKDGYLLAQVAGLTNTLRFQHTTIVNLPKVGKPYGYETRGSLITDDDCELCGADMSSLEDRLKQHFIFPLDPEYVKTMMRDDFDPHLELAMMGGKVSKEEKAFYQKYDKLSNEEKKNAPEKDTKEFKRIKKIRDVFKNGNYACQYGAYPPRLAITCNIPLEEAKEVFNAYWKLNWAIKEVSQSLIVKEIDGFKWQYNPVNGFWYNLRSENDRFSTLVQGTASYVFDIWVQYVLEGREQLTAQFHDEIVLTVKKNFREQIEKYLKTTIDKTNNFLKLNRELSIGVQFGKNYAEIH